VPAQLTLRRSAELGRPQIHGYPLASVAFTSSNKRLQFVSGADEKIVRVFDAPKTWVQTLRALSGVEVGDEVRDLSPLRVRAKLTMVSARRSLDRWRQTFLLSASRTEPSPVRLLLLRSRRTASWA